MVDLVITAANVVPQTGALIEHGTYGATVTAGMSVYLNTTTREWEPADADTLATANAAGIALNSAGDGQPGAVVVEGPVALGAVLTVGSVYVVSSTAGGIAPSADLVATDYVSVLGTPISTSVLQVKRIITGVAKA